MIKKIKKVVWVLFTLTVLSSCAIPPPDLYMPKETEKIEPNKVYLEIANTFNSFSEAKELYVGFSETCVLNDTLLYKTELSAFNKPNFSEMNSYELDGESLKETKSNITKTGKKIEKSGDIDFIEKYGEDFANEYIYELMSSYLAIIESPQFSQTEDKGKLVLTCIDSSLISSYNTILPDENVKSSGLVIVIEKDEKEGLLITSTTDIIGTEWEMKLVKVIQFIPEDVSK